MKKGEGKLGKRNKKIKKDRGEDEKVGCAEVSEVV